MNETFIIWIVAFIMGCIYAFVRWTIKRKRERKWQAEYIKFMEEHNIIITGMDGL